MASLKTTFFANFGHPEGVLGWVAGRLMAAKNAGANRRLVEVLDVKAGETVLDVGCGPGVALEAAAARVGSGGSVIGVDSSPVVVRMARRRVPSATVVRAPAEELPLGDATVDAACSLNSIGHWDDLEAGVAELARVVRPGGRLAIGLRSRARNGAPPVPMDVVERVAKAVTTAGFDVAPVREEAGGGEHFHLVAGFRQRYGPC